MNTPTPNDGAAPRPAGNDATRPSDIPLRAWWSIARRVVREVGDDHVGLVSAGVAFYLFLSLFPAILALLSVYGLFADPSHVADQLDALAGAIPDQAREVLLEQMRAIAAGQDRSLGAGVLLGIATALWGASKSMKALMAALNIAYEERESRGFVRKSLLALGMTGSIVVGLLAAVAAIAVVPIAFAALGAQGLGVTLVSLARWPLLALGFVGLLTVLYRRTPAREPARWRWATPGAIFATTSWLLLSVAFSLYVDHSGKYNETYGSLGAVVVLLMWLYLTAYVVLVGGELNAEIELQTRRDTTAGPAEPRGSRGAYVADHSIADLEHEDRPTEDVSEGA